MKVIYMSHRYHTNQTTIMKGWTENGHEVRFLSQYAGRIEDYTYVKPIVVGYSKLFMIFDYRILFTCNYVKFKVNFLRDHPVFRISFSSVSQSPVLSVDGEV